MARRVVPLRPHAFDEEVWLPALERARAFLDAAHHVVAVQQGTVRQTDRWIDSFGNAVVDDGRGVSANTTTPSATIRLSPDDPDAVVLLTSHPLNGPPPHRLEGSRYKLPMAPATGCAPGTHPATHSSTAGHPRD